MFNKPRSSKFDTPSDALLWDLFNKSIVSLTNDGSDAGSCMWESPAELCTSDIYYICRVFAHSTVTR
ncbi:hypothetical protein DPMN_176964 [Dreissena polymorpha]|uniref:Uncharacterized protein n=1 Tax=Dreissena polymorpha TaxID=45954 RepID=A0A9D4EAU8_DREPO|nr:hypothetical protein DPMN_176964 [Dreissena polymorpha]